MPFVVVTINGTNASGTAEAVANTIVLPPELVVVMSDAPLGTKVSAEYDSDKIVRPKLFVVVIMIGT